MKKKYLNLKKGIDSNDDKRTLSTGIMSSMPECRNSYENALAERFFSIFKMLYEAL